MITINDGSSFGVYHFYNQHLLNVPVINHLRGSFPTTINADTPKKLGFAPKNESYVLGRVKAPEVI